MLVILMQKKKKNNAGEKIIMLSWVVPGNIYPVAEDPNKVLDPSSLYGAACRSGFQSHYVLVNPGGMPRMDVQLAGFDEMVVFENAQILPQYILYCT